MLKIPLIKKMLKFAGRGLVLTGHGVAKTFKNREVEEVHIPFSDFTDVIELLIQLEYDFLDMEQVIDLSKRDFIHSKHWVHLTFDDGYQNIYDTVYPFLKEQNIPFSVFISTHHSETQTRFPTFYVRLAQSMGKDLGQVFNVDNNLSSASFETLLKYSPSSQHELYLNNIKSLFNACELLELEKYLNDAPLNIYSIKKLASDPKVHIGSHMHHHWVFHPQQDYHAMDDDLKQSMRVIKDVFGVHMQSTFCYPNGDYDRNSLDICLNQKIPLCFVSKSGFVDKKTNPMMIPRFAISNKKRIFLLCLLSIIGNNILNLIGRKRPGKYI
jgi:peptidoglycan/xylan/chitin deacetylase (PgdA/CDA1 family)